MEEDNCTETVLEKMAEMLKERGHEYELDPEWRDGTLVYKDKAGSFYECWKAGSSELVNVIITVTPEQALSVDDLNGIIDENAKLRHDFSDACVRFFNASRDCEHLRDDLAILTHKHECLISAVTHGLVSKVQTPNEDVERLVREYWERERQEIEDENERLKSRLDNLEDHDQYIKTALAEVGCDECGEYKQEAHRLFEEVAKLRELARRFGGYVSQDHCEGCVMKRRCNNGDVEECWQLTEIRALSNELGVEVPQ